MADEKDQQTEAERVEAAQKAEQKAAEKRQAVQEKQAATASDKLGTDAGAPSERTRKGDKSFSRERLLTDSQDLVGHPPHVLAGALYGDDREYLTLDEAEAAVNDYLSREVPA